MLSGGDSSRNCIKLSIAEAEVGFDENNETVGEMFLAPPRPRLRATHCSSAMLAEQRPPLAASNHSVGYSVLLQQPHEPMMG
jgi:hypothetical protein